MTHIPCSECGTAVPVKSRGRRPKYCRPCGVDIDREKAAERMRAIDADRSLLREVAGNLRDYVTDEMWVRVEQYLDELGLDAGTAPPIVPDRMPDGTSSHAGPDEGTSTGYLDLADTLEQQRMQAIMHDWFVDNPRWLDGVNG